MQGYCDLCGRQAAPIAAQLMVDGKPLQLCGVDLGLPLAAILLNLQSLNRRSYAAPADTGSLPPPPPITANDG